MGGFAWVTLVTNDSYSLGALVLANSLRRVNTAHQLVVLITPSVTEAMKTQLSAVFNVVKVVDVLDSQDADNLALLARPELGITFTKLHCWRLTEFDKCVFLDADTLVLQNSDELFEREELSAAPDVGWPDCFNSGVFVYKPSNETFKALMEFALLHGSFDGGDQGLLNLFFKDWATKDITKHLPFVYNMCSTATYSYPPAFKQFGEGLKIVHFIGPAKPWLQPFNTESGLVQVSGESQHVKQFVQLWWDIFCAHVHPSLSSEMAGLAAALASVTLGAPLLAEQSALEEHLRRQGWEQGNVDYMGKDSFSNIWHKICDTLASGSQPSSSEPPTLSASDASTTPVAPVAAPVFVSSVEMSPSGPIDTSPPASYVPVSSSKLIVVDSETEAASKAAPAETTTVLPESKSSVTEVIPTEASITSSASVDTSVQPVPAPSGQTPAVQDISAPILPVVDATKVEPTPESLTSQSQATLPETLPPSQPLVTSPEPQVPTDTAVEASAPVLQQTDIPTALQKGEVGTPALLKLEPTAKSDPPLTPVEITPSPQKPVEVVSSSAATEVTSSSVIAEVVKAAAEVTPTDIPVSTLEKAAVTIPPVEISTGVTPPNKSEEPILIPPNVETAGSITSVTSAEAVVTPPVVVPTETSIPSTQPEIAVNKKEAVPVDPNATAIPLPSETPDVISAIVLPVVSTSLPSTDTPISTIPIEATPITVSQPPPEIPPVVASSDVSPVPITAEPAVTEVSKVPPTAVLPSPTNQRASEIKSSDIATPIQTTPQQPQTPTVTEPTPPTSPPTGPVEAPLVTKLQVETEVPATPPLESSAAQPPLATSSTEEPPVPPKRKGGSKSSQDTKNQKGGKQPKGKK